MAPIKDETVEGLRDMVSKLESRVSQLESKVAEANGESASRKSGGTVPSVRLILMGPPGAGTRPAFQLQ